MSGFDSFDACKQREWAAQEHADREERRGSSPSDDARDSQYRLIARALRRPHIDPIPSNFAYQIAAHIERAATIGDERFEVWLQRILVVAMLLAGGVTAAMLSASTRVELLTPIERPLAYGLQAFNGWGLIAAACVGLSWVMGRWRSAADRN